MTTATGTESTGQAPGSTDQQTGQAPPVQQTDGGTGSTDATTRQIDPATIQDPALRAYVEGVQRDASEARAEAARFRQERAQATSAAEAARRATETAEQTAQREAQERDQRLQALEDENRTLKIGGQFTTAAGAAGALDPQAVLALVGGPARVTLDDQGQVTNAPALIQEARTKYPWAFSRTTADGGAGRDDQGSAGTGGGMNDFIRGGRPATAR